MKEIWNKLEEYFEKNEPEVLANFNPPATEQEIKKAEADISKEAKKHIALPRELVESLKVHNGQQGEKRNTIFTNWRLLPVKDMAWWQMKHIADHENDQGEIETTDEKIKADHGVKAVAFNRCWIPIAGHGHVPHYVFIDLDPAPGGTPGQVVIADIDDTITYRKVANSFKEWFTKMVEARITGTDYKIDGFNLSTESISNTSVTCMNLKESEQTLVVLANAGELVNNIAQGVIGKEVADTFAGSPLSRSVIFNLAQTQFQAAVSKFLGGA